MKVPINVAVNPVSSEMAEIVSTLMNVNVQISIVISMLSVSIKMVFTNANAMRGIGEVASSVWTRTNVHLALTHAITTLIALTFRVHLNVNAELASRVLVVMMLTNVVLIRIDATMMQSVQIQ